MNLINTTPLSDLKVTLLDGAYSALLSPPKAWPNELRSFNIPIMIEGDSTHPVSYYLDALKEIMDDEFVLQVGGRNRRFKLKYSEISNFKDWSDCYVFDLGLTDDYPDVYSHTRTESFTKNTCAEHLHGSTVSYTKIYRSFSMADAILYAGADDSFSANGQAYANEKGECIADWFAVKTQDFTRNDCAVLYDGSTVPYSKTYWSAVSQVAADALRDADAGFASEGQANANTEGTCVYNFATAITTFKAAVVADSGSVAAIWDTEIASVPTLVKTDATNILVSGALKNSKLYGFNPLTGGKVDLSFSRAGAATYFDKDGLLQSAASGVPRIRYNRNTLALEGYLLENSVKNYALQSNIQSNAFWVKASPTQVTAETVGGIAGYKAYVDAAGILDINGNCGTVSPRAISLLVRMGDFRYMQISGRAFVGQMKATFDLQSGVVVAYTADETASIVPMGNGWYMISCYVFGSTNSPQLRILSVDSSGVQTSIPTGSYVHIAELQVENGTATTSRIRTAASAVTRPADSCTVTVTAGSVFINNGGVKTVQTVSAGTFTMPYGSIRQFAAFGRVLSGPEITSLTT